MAAIHTQEGTIYYEKGRNRWRCDYKIFDPNTSKLIKKCKTFRSEQEARGFFSMLQYQKGNNANRNLQKIAQNFGIENISTHSLRHTYGTRCIEAGMRAVALQRLMGHTDISVTLNTYTSIFNKYKEQELEKVNEYYLNNEILIKRNLLNDDTENIRN